MFGIYSWPAGGHGKGGFQNPHVGGLGAVDATGADQAGAIIPAALHFWPMNEGSGSTFVDHIGTNNAALTAVTWAVTTGMGATSVSQFNGTTSTAIATYEAAIDFDGTKPYSVSIWARPTVTPDGNLFNTENAGFSAGWIVDMGAGIRFFMLGAGQGSNSTAFSINTTYHIVGTYAVIGGFGISTLYVNGVGNAPNSVAIGASGASATPLHFGSSATGAAQAYTGALAFARIWTTALTAAQVAKLYFLGPQ